MGTDNKMNLEKILKSIDHIKNFNMQRYEKMKKIYEDCSSAGTIIQMKILLYFFL